MSSADIHYFHRYRTLSNRRLVTPLTCSCGKVYALISDTEGEAMLQCFYCGSLVTPGLKMIDEVKEAVERFNQ